MVRYVLIILLILLNGSLTYAQFNIPEINKLKEIKLLESTAFDVQRILVGVETDGWKPGDLEQEYSTHSFSIDISYSSGQCSEDDDEIWNGKEWTVTKIVIEPGESLRIKDLGYDFGKFMKEQVYDGRPRLVIYHDKGKGIAFETDENKGEVKKILLFPPKGIKVNICDNETAKQFLNYDSWFGSTKLKDRPYGIREYSADVSEVVLSKEELGFTEPEKEISVEVTTNTDANDVITYKYAVSGGRILGEGPKVIWSLKGLPPGTYTINAGVDDGCGICGKTMTKTVTIK